jgi:GNAT superfamily N-acetyltransferase
MHYLLAHVGLPLGDLHMWVLSCVLQGAAIGLASAAMLGALRRGSGTRQHGLQTLVHKHYLYKATPELKSQLALFIQQQGPHRPHADVAAFLESMSVCWTATRGERIVGVVFVRAKLWALRSELYGPRDMLYATWTPAHYISLWDDIPTTDGFEQRVVTTLNVRALLVSARCRGQGVARLLMQTVLGDARHGTPRPQMLELHVDKQPEQAHMWLVRWYQQLGFVVVQARRHDLHLACFLAGE